MSPDISITEIKKFQITEIKEEEQQKEKKNAEIIFLEIQKYKLLEYRNTEIQICQNINYRSTEIQITKIQK